MTNGLRVAIIGGKAQRQYFRERDDVETWGLNAIRFPWVKKWDRMFNLHILQRLKDYGYNLETEREWCNENPEVPFYTLDKWPQWWAPGQTLFPRSAMAKRMPRGDYHCGSFDWMVAFAIFLGAKEINLHGIGLCLEAGEPLSARACLEYWCGYAEGRGCKINIAKDTDIFHFYHLVKSKLIYGVDDTPIYEDRTKKGVAYKL